MIIGKFVEAGKMQIKKSIPITICVGAAMAAGVGALTPPPLIEYTFVPDSDRWVEVTREGDRFFGKLDRQGNFVHVYRYPLSAEISCRPPAIPITPAAGTTESVYEYRSGRLIPGILDTTGNFVPELSGKIIDLADYEFGRDPRRIWNLPGKFVSKLNSDR